MAVKVFTWVEWCGSTLSRFDGFYQLYDSEGATAMPDDIVLKSRERGLDGGYWTMPADIVCEADAQKAAEAVGAIILDRYYKDMKEEQSGTSIETDG